MLDLIYRDLLEQVRIGAINLENFYRRLYINIVGMLVILAVAALTLNLTGHRWVNIALILPTVLAIAYLGFQPFYLLGIAAAARLTGFKARAALETWKKFCVQAALFASVFLLTLGIVPVRESLGGTLLIMSSLVVLGLLAWAFKIEGKGYQKYVLFLALLGVTIGTISLLAPAQRISLMGFDPLRAFSISEEQKLAQRILDEDQDKREAAAAASLAAKRGKELSNHERAEIRALAAGKGNIAEQGKHVLVGQVLTYNLSSLEEPQVLCGLEPGKSYVYSITDGARFFVRDREDRSRSPNNLNGSIIETNGETLPFAGNDKGWALTLNGSLPDSLATSNEDGCFQVALNLTQAIKAAYEIDGGRHLVKIRLQAGPVAALRTW